MRKGFLTAALLMTAAACLSAADGAEPAAIPPISPGLARVWFFRQFEPGESLRTPMIFINGAPFASSTPGTVFYRDFAPGGYNFSVETCTRDTNQDTSLNLQPGTETDLEVQSLSSFYAYDCSPDETFYIRPISSRFAQLYFPQLAYLGAR